MSLQTARPAKVTRVIPGSIAEEIGFEPGDSLVSINDQIPRDLIDYRFLCADEEITLEVLDAQGHSHRIEIEKEIDEELGLEFETALFDGLMQCNNRCPFCFIDQQPPGKRETLYLKDDDYRLSFLYGSYLTLTNLLPQEWDRIARMRLSPLYVSVHATEPEVRSQLLKNPRAGEILQQLQWFQAQRLQIHAQVVVCPGINDGQHLETTLRDLAQFHQGDLPTVASVAVVPVGLTRFRPNQDELIPVTPAKAREVIAQVESLQAELRQKTQSNLIWLADEWYLIGRQPLPPATHYEDYPQIGNGVGSIRQFLSQLEAAGEQLPETIHPPQHFTWVVGNAVEQALQPFLHHLNQVQGLTVDLAPIASTYWGQEITVTGLLTGEDILSTLQGQTLGDAILLPAVMLRRGDSGSLEDTLFLDDMSVAAVSRQLQCPIWPVEDALALVQACQSTQPAKSISNSSVGYWVPS